MVWMMTAFQRVGHLESPPKPCHGSTYFTVGVEGMHVPSIFLLKFEMASSIGSHLVQQSVECVRDEILILVPSGFSDDYLPDYVTEFAQAWENYTQQV